MCTVVSVYVPRIHRVYNMDRAFDKLIEKNNLESWKMHLRNILEYEDIYDIVIGENVAPAAGIEDYDSKFKLWKKSDAKGRMLLTQRIFSSIVLQMDGCSSLLLMICGHSYTNIMTSTMRKI